MMQKALSNPAELYEAAIKHTSKIFVGVKPSQYKDSTPCDKWNVQQLMEHITGGLGLAVASFAGADVTMEDHDIAKGGITVEHYNRASKRAVEVIKKPGAMSKPIKTPLGEMPGAQFAGILFMDQLVHGWDLAKATKQDTTFPKELAEAAYAMFAPQFANLQKSGAFKPSIPVPASASAQVKLLAGLGRKA